MSKNSSILKYVIKRLLLALFILIGVSLILYILIRLMPLNVIEANYYKTHTKGDAADEAQLAEILARYNLDDKSFGGICKGWWNWITKFFSGDLGRTLTNNRDVGEVIFENMGVSFAVSLISLVLELIIAIPLGIKCACNQYGKLDYTVTVLTMIGISFPSFFFASIIIKIFAVDLGWFPINGLNTPTANYTGIMNILDMAWHMILPIFVLTILSIDDETYQNEYA